MKKTACFHFAALKGAAVLALSAAFLLIQTSAAQATTFLHIDEDITFEEAKAQAVEQDKLLVAKMTAVWCPPCKMMDRNTWPEENLAKWMDEHAIAVSIDVDKQPELSQQLRTQAMPTIIVFREGEEFARFVGGRDADFVLDWLEQVHAGEVPYDPSASYDEPSLDELKDQGERGDMQARLQYAQELMYAERFDEAAEEFVWLWNNMLEEEQAMYGVRLSFMISSMEELAAQHEPAFEAFAHLRDIAEQNAMPGKGMKRESFIDWLHLTRMLGDDDRVALWAQRAVDLGGVPSTHPSLTYVNDVLTSLCSEDELLLMGKLLRDPVGHINETIEGISTSVELMRELGEADMVDDMLDYYRQEAEADIKHLYAGCLAAGRNPEAKEIADIAFAAFDDAALKRRLFDEAMRAKAPREYHIEWIEAIEAETGERDEYRRQQLEEAFEATNSEA